LHFAVKLFRWMETKQTTLVILSPGFPKNEADSTCLPAVQNFVAALNVQFPLVKIIVLAFDYPYISTSYQWHGNTVTAFNGLKKRKLRKIFKWLSIWRKLNELKRKNNIIGLLSFWCGDCAYVGSRYAKRNRLKHYCWLMGQDAGKENSYAGRIKTSPHELIAISDFIQTTFEKNHKIQPQHVIPIGIDGDKFPKEEATRDIDILGAGSLIPLKQFDVFLDIVTGIKKEFADVNVIIAGDGPQKRKLLSLITALGLQKNVSLAGEFPYHEVLALMQRTKILLHPSSYEGFSGVCLEALYAGAHVISFCKPMNENTDHWHIVKDKEEMEEKALEILQNPGTAYTSKNPFPIDYTAKKIVKLFTT
jgi:glycosyltransferase involved in cell wall biosynthesis